jgi:hypothetical protein
MQQSRSLIFGLIPPLCICSGCMKVKNIAHIFIIKRKDAVNQDKRLSEL